MRPARPVLHGRAARPRAGALATVGYCADLTQRFGSDRRLQFYVAPLGPFLDPGCRAALDPRLGYRRHCTTLEQRRQALLGPTWRETLSYETAWMDRDQIVATTYDVAEGLNEVKFRARLIGAAAHDAVCAHLASARRVLREAGAARRLPADQRGARLRALRREVDAANEATLCDSGELKWNSRTGIRVS